jgi:transcriptional antiterminator RfaH
MKRWFAVHTRAHSEQRASTNLERQGFEAWLPLYRKARRHAGRIEQVLKPLFPRYLFVALDLSAERWRAILSTYGVAGLVGSEEGPRPVPEGVVEALRARADDDGTFTLERASRLKPGDRVRIETGPMRDLEGVFQAASDAERVVVLLTLMGRDLRVTVRADSIERA